MTESLWSYFTDPILRAPTIGCMLMCLSAALIGVFTYLRKQSLVGETLSHASYPGVILGALFAAVWIPNDATRLWSSFFSLAGAFLSALLGNYMIHLLQVRWKIRSDSALCFVLSLFFGLGILIASGMQFSHASVYKQSLSYLYGQAATMKDIHILLYGILSLLVTSSIVLFYKELKVITFDRDYAQAMGLRVKLIEWALLGLLSLSIVVGIRSVGVVLMSAMLIAPPVAARQFTHRLSFMLLLSGIFGLMSGLLGNVLTEELSAYFRLLYPEERISVPTGPMIVMVATTICIFSLLFAPKRGICVKLLRTQAFRAKCVRESLLKGLSKQNSVSFTLEEIKQTQSASKAYLALLLASLRCQGWLKRHKSSYSLTPKGKQHAEHLISLHRPWEI